MKNNRIIAALFTLLLLVSCIGGMTASATQSSTISEEQQNSLNSRLHAFLENRKSSHTIKEIKPLYGMDNTVIAYVYLLEPVGYVIINNDCLVVEASLDNGFAGQSKTKLYYTGPFQYFEKVNDGYVNLTNDLKVSESEYLEAFDDYQEKTERAIQSELISASSASRSLSYDIYRIPGTMRTYDYNPNGICGSTAATIFLMYYRDYIDSWVVPSWHVTSDGISLIKLLEPNIDGSVPGSNTADMVSGLNWYFRWRGISGTYNSVSQQPATFARYQQRINANRPVIIDLNAHPTYGEHWVIGHGWATENHAGKNYQYVVASNGWGTNNNEISMIYVGDIVYLNI